MRIPHIGWVVLTIVAAWCDAPALSAQSSGEFIWKTATPESQGMSSERLKAYQEELAERSTRNLIVIRNDRIVLEWYAEGRTADDRHSTASLAKALVGGMSLAVAITDGRIALDDPAWKYIPAWKDDPVRSKITVRQLGSHTSGIDDSHNREERARGIDQGDYTGWSGEFWRWRQGEQRPPNDAFTISRDLAPVLFEPGTDFQYSNPGLALLGWCVTASLKGTPHEDLRTLLRERIMRPIGADDRDWSCGYGMTETVNGLPMVANWGGGSFTPRAVARIGRLVLREGNWGGKQLVSAEAIRQVTQDAGLPGGCGMGWWTNGGSRYPDVPDDAVWGAGAGDQILLVVPSLNLIMVRNGGSLTGKSDSDARVQILFDPLIAAITEKPRSSGAATPSGRTSGSQRSATGEAGTSGKLGDAPYPPSDVITGIEWAPIDSIIRCAEGSDNWPMTWADDDHQYTSYGDGWGFEPMVEMKLSLGLAKVTGGPSDFQGINVRSESAEERGDGARGRKASGMLCVDGVLYMLARNADNSQLAWSDDHGRTWTWADWKWMTSFGCPTFLNFGKNYSGARDEFVYLYSFDSDSAYIAADHYVMARVPQDRIKEQGAYEYFTGIDERGQPTWSANIEEREAVFSHPGRCYRSGITYNAPLQRYLWCQVLPESTHRQGSRYQGGFGIYEAPEPWGPWKTVDFTNAWDVGPGETNSFPTKWMSDDGKTLHLVFSGDDHFSVRQARLKTAE